MASNSGLVRFLMIVSGYPPAKSAGMERGAQRLASALARRGHEVRIVTLATEGLEGIAEEEPRLWVHRKIAPLALGPLWGLTYMSQVASAMHQLAGQFDFCLCHKLYLHCVPAARVGRKLGKKTATLLVNAGEYSDIAGLRAHRGGRILVKEALRTDGVFALSERSRAELREAGVEEGRIHSYAYFVDEKFLKGDASGGSTCVSRVRPEDQPCAVSLPHAQTLNLPSHPQGPDSRADMPHIIDAGLPVAPARRRCYPGTILFLGRFHAQKNIPLLVRAFARVAEQLPEARLRLVGKGPAEAEVRAAVESSPARDRIEVFSWTDNPTAEYQRAVATVTASDAEGLSNVLVETLACGTPAITTDVSGARDVLDAHAALAGRALAPGEVFTAAAGMIVGIRDEDALVAAMKRILTDAALRDAMSVAARERVLTHYTEQVCVDEFLRGVDAIMRA